MGEELNIFRMEMYIMENMLTVSQKGKGCIYGKMEMNFEVLLVNKLQS
jgi:hypothetical protein